MHSVNVIRFFNILLAKVSNEQINVFCVGKWEYFSLIGDYYKRGFYLR